MPYFVLQSGEDGISISEYTAEALRTALRPEADGTFEEFGVVEGFCTTAAELDGYNDKLLIIKGEIVVPTIKTVVQEYDL